MAGTRAGAAKAMVTRKRNEADRQARAEGEDQTGGGPRTADPVPGPATDTVSNTAGEGAQPDRTSLVIAQESIEALRTAVTEQPREIFLNQAAVEAIVGGMASAVLEQISPLLPAGEGTPLLNVHLFESVSIGGRELTHLNPDAQAFRDNDLRLLWHQGALHVRWCGKEGEERRVIVPPSNIRWMEAMKTEAELAAGAASERVAS